MFVHTALTWGFFLALAPLLIHLINLVRRRRVKWAAMDFLWQSYRKHQKWIWLQQFLLLLLRMLAVVVAVAMLAQWLARNQWFSLLSGRATHHFVLVDDSLSMSERFGGVTAFDKAMQTLSRIASQAMAQESPQKMTIVRFSRAAGVPQDEAAASIGQLADMNGEPVDARFDLLLEEQRRGLQVTELALGPRTALELVHELARLTPDEGHVLHLLSDFRNPDWANPAELKQLLQQVDDATEQVQFIDCSPEAEQTNLAVTDVRPGEEIRAAGVPLQVEITVANFGQETARKIPVTIHSTFFDPVLSASAEPGKLMGKTDEPPTVLIDELPGGQTTTRQVQVFFPRPGQHIVEALLPEDVVHADNRRWCVVDIPEGEKVLAIDGDPAQRNAYYLTSAFQPGPRAPTGIRVETQTAAHLRDATEESLAPYRAIYLLDVDRLEDRAVENLEAFVKAGGGLGVFVGERVQHSFYSSRLYRNGAGVFPLPLERDDLLPADVEDDVPDFEVTNHPLFSIFFGERNPFIRLVSVERFLRPPLNWAPDPNSTTAVIAKLRNRQPLVVERRFGEGRVVVFLTTLAPQWNNWANDPSFVVVLLKLQSFLAAPQRRVDPRLVGSPLSVELAGTGFRPDVTFVAPGEKPDFPVVLRRTASASGPPDNLLTAMLAGLSRDEANTGRSGVYEVWPATAAGTFDVRRFAFNVNPSESDLTHVSSRTLLAGLAPVRIRMRKADDLAFDLTEEAGLHRGTWLLGLLVVLLVGEQLLAYFASYHPSPGSGAVRA